MTEKWSELILLTFFPAVLQTLMPQQWASEQGTQTPAPAQQLPLHPTHLWSEWRAGQENGQVFPLFNRIRHIASHCSLIGSMH